jgi:hypothetical protein
MQLTTTKKRAITNPRAGKISSRSAVPDFDVKVNEQSGLTGKPG